MYLSVRACVVWGLSNNLLTKQIVPAILFLVDIYFFRTGIRIYLQPGTYVCVILGGTSPHVGFLSVLLHDRHAFGYSALWFPFLLVLLNARTLPARVAHCSGGLCVSSSPRPQETRKKEEKTHRPFVSLHSPTLFRWRKIGLPENTCIISSPYLFRDATHMVLPVFLPPLLSSASCRTKPQK